MIEREEAIRGAMLGCAIGDALGLPYENLSRRRAARLLGEPDRYRFFRGRGMVSDDTQHTWMTAQSLCEHPTDPESFVRALARRFRWWLMGQPAGIGLATLKAILKLWLGFSPHRSGVFSAGNGPAMRMAILGSAIDDLPTLLRFAEVSTRLTHTDPKALEGAFAIALAGWCARRGISDANGFFGKYRTTPGINLSPEFASLLQQVESDLLTGKSVEEFAEGLGCRKGVSGYVYRTVPVVLFAWLHHRGDFRKIVTDLIRCGGDTDTTAAIAGSIAGCGLGGSRLPAEWIVGLWEWPRSVAWSDQLASQLAEAITTQTPVKPMRTNPFAEVGRNLVFLGIVLGHVARRVLPPY
jgi:ADP-ribosyl-[dinitrogen reductase] hydrolase